MMHRHHRSRMLALDTPTATLKQNDSKGEIDKKEKLLNQQDSKDVAVYAVKAIQIHISYMF